MLNTDCTETSCPDGSAPYYIRQPYNASASLTAVDLHLPAEIPYLGGDIAGGTVQDVFSFPSADLKWNQTFLSVNESSWTFVTADGFLGLAFSSIAEQNTTTVVETLMQDGLLDAPCFSLFYGTNLTDDGPQDGVLTIGGTHDEKYVDGEMVYTPLRKDDEYQLWRAPLRSISLLVAEDPSGPNSTVEIHNGRFPTTNLSPGASPAANWTWGTYGVGSAVFDTGAGRLSIPQEDIYAFYSFLGWNYTKLTNQEERFECKHLNASWAVTMTFGDADPEDDVSFSMRGDEFIYPGDECMPPVDPGQDSFALVGAAFLRRHYSVFDFGSDKVDEYAPRVGFGRLKKEYDYLY